MTVVGHRQETMLLRVKYKTYFLIRIYNSGRKLPQYFQLRWSSGAKVIMSACCTEQRNDQDSDQIKFKTKYFTIDTPQNQLLAHYVNQKKKPYETTILGSPLKLIITQYLAKQKKPIWVFQCYCFVKQLFYVYDIWKKLAKELIFK